MLRSRIIKDMDKLVHDKKEGFYDRECDMFFTDLNEWSLFKYGINLHEIDL